MAIEPEEFKLETTTVWSFPERGSWASHSNDYRGNWAPQIPRNIILRYSQQKDLVLDQMVGSGTTLIECMLTKRKSIGVDISPEAVELAKKNINFKKAKSNNYFPTLKLGDARNLDFIETEVVDLIVTHPPYLNIIRYGNGKIDGDLSDISSPTKFCKQIRMVAKECFRVLKPGKYCAILIGDTRRRRHFVPLAFKVMKEFLKVGFILKEDIIKKQWNCKSTGTWVSSAKKYNFLLIMHEHLFVFRKPRPKENINKYKYSIQV